MSPRSSADDALLLFSQARLGASDALLAARSYEECSERMRRCAWLLVDRPSLLADALLSPMRTWGASPTFAPLRQYERMLRLSFWTRDITTLGGALFAAFGRESPKAPPRWWWSFAGLLLAGAPLSFTASIPLSQFAGRLAGSDAAVLFASAVVPVLLGMFETRVLFRLWPQANPARMIVGRWILPGLSEAELCAQRARECFSQQEESCPDAAPAAFATWHRGLHTPLFGLATAKASSSEAAHEHVMALSTLGILAQRLAEAGLDPAQDAALFVLADQEREALDQMPMGAAREPRPSVKRARPRSL